MQLLCSCCSTVYCILRVTISAAFIHPLTPHNMVGQYLRHRQNFNGDAKLESSVRDEYLDIKE